MPIGRKCVAHYRELSRYCVFSHDEMVCNMASKADTMDADMAAILQKEMIVMVEEEEKLREIVKKMVISFIWCIFFLLCILCIIQVQWCKIVSAIWVKVQTVQVWSLE